MDTPQEVEVWYILPALRRQLAMSLKEEGLKQKQIAACLNLTEAAVSQYLKKKRGEDLQFPAQIMSEISKSAKVISENPKQAREELQRIMRTITKAKFICNVCHSHTNSSSDCRICY